jgi:predicted ArsR family transcriptional regulator
MTPGPDFTPFLITPAHQTMLERWSRMTTVPQRIVRRCRIVLMLGEGMPAREVARRLSISRHTVDLWRLRYLDDGPYVVLRDKPGRGRPPRAQGSSSPGCTFATMSQ